VSAGHRNREGHVSPEVMARVFDALEREADMDGLVTASGARIGELVGISQMAANDAIHLLAEAGRVFIVGRIGSGGVLAVQLIEVIA